MNHQQPHHSGGMPAQLHPHTMTSRAAAAPVRQIITPNATTTVLNMYVNVMDEVALNLQETFLDEGVDLSVLNELRRVWDNKLQNTKVLEDRRPTQQQQYITTPNGQSFQLAPGVLQGAVPGGYPRMYTAGQQQPPQYLPTGSAPVYMTQPAVGGMYPSSSVPGGPSFVLQPQQHSAGVRGQPMQHPGPSHTPFIQIDGASHQPSLSPDNSFQESSSAGCSTPTIGATIEITLPELRSESPCRLKTRRSKTKSKAPILQLDGNTKPETGEESDDDDDDSDDSDDEKDADSAEGEEEEPLNSGDDVSDNDDHVFDTDNVVVCQFDKIHRNKNKWRLSLKDGIMNVNGRDLVFHRANGDADW